MSLAPGARLGPYVIVAPIGSGGMGEVFKATDTRLHRTVAIKVLPPGVGLDPERRQRFEREARLIASLNHPHICAVHDVGSEASSDGALLSYLVMEFVEGESLADRLHRGPLPAGDVARLGATIADALAAAHRERIVHRDLKPGNVMLTKAGGGVKLLDFGIAKALEPAAPGDLLSTKALTVATAPGSTPGTLPYMSPEQLEGRAVDARSDIFSLGAVLFEMATGRRAFPGDSYAAVSSSIMTAAPPPIAASPALDRIARGCLEKDPEQRWQSAHDIARQLRTLAAGETAEEVARPRRRAAWVPWAVALVAIVAALAVWLSGRRSGTSEGAQTPDDVLMFAIPPPREPDGFIHGYLYTVEHPSMAVSPDGSHLAFATVSRAGETKLWVRPLASLDARPLSGTEGAASMFWSPDSRSIAFFAGGALKRVDLAGGAPLSICPVMQAIGLFGSWGAEDTILFASVQGDAIMNVPAAGGTPVEVLKPDPARQESRTAWPTYLPDGRSFIYMAALPDDKGALMLVRPGEPPVELIRAKSNVQYVDPGYLLYAQDSTLVARRFDATTGQVSGAPIPVADPVTWFGSTGMAEFSASRTGTIVFQSHQQLTRIAWFGRSGEDLGTVRGPGGYLTLRLSRSGRQLLFDRTNPRTTTFDIYLLELDRSAETQITSESGTESMPLWENADTMIYSSAQGRAPRLHRRGFASGRAEAVGPDAPGLQMAKDLSPDGKWLLYGQRSRRGDFDLLAMNLADRTSIVVRDTPADESDGRFSPDGRYVAFSSTEGDRMGVYVTPFQAPGSRRPVSTGTASVPRWSRDGRELFFISMVSDEAHLVKVAMRLAPSLEIGKPERLFSFPPGRRWADYEPVPDGRFLAIQFVQFRGLQPLTVIANWRASGR